jgi:phage terminase large subunit-like protein
MRTARPRRTRDPVTAYAESVVGGQTVASRCVVAACRRHLADLDVAAARGWEWRAAAAVDVIEFFRDVLCLPEDSDAGDDASTAASDDAPPFILSPWQQFVVGSLMGWYTARGDRRFRTAYIETGKGSGKTPMCAGLLLYMLVSDRERGGQYYVAAVTREQAGIAFADIERMVAASPHLRDVMLPTKNNLALPRTSSFIRAISAERRALDGKRISGALIDELHEQPTPVVVNKIRRGTKARRNALILEPTNAGFDRTSVCWAHHEYSRKVLDGTIPGDDWFAFICALDPCDECVARGRWFPDDDCPNCDSWQTEGPHWTKPNPNLGVSLPWSYVRALVRQAVGMPSEVSSLLRFNFGIWTRGVDRAVDMGRWAQCQPLPSDDDLAAADAFGSFDLGETDDFSAWCRLWVLDDGRVAVKMRYFLPSAALERYPDRPYQEWERAGALVVTDGDVIDFSVVRQAIRDDWSADGLRAVYYDTRSARETAQLLTAEGLDLVPLTQGFPLHEAIKRFSALIAAGLLCHGNDPILAWMAANLVLVTGAKGEKRIAKERSPEKIDGIAAVVMAIDGAIVRRDRTDNTPEYQTYFFG